MSAVALAIEMPTLYASGRREICVQKLGNAYQRKEIEKHMTHFTIGFNKRFFGEDARFPFTIVACLPVIV